MPVATISFSGCEQSQNDGQIDVCVLQNFVMVVLDRHFSSYDQAAAAQDEYRRVQADIEADTSLTLFGTSEAVRSGLAAHPAALAWSDFEAEAAGKIHPCHFTIRFTS